MVMADDGIELDGYGAVLRPDWSRLIEVERHPMDGSLVCTVPAASRTRNGPSLVLLHGVGNNAAIFGPVMPSLAELGDVVAPTMSPHLLTGLGDARADMSAKLVDWLGEVAPPPWRIVGHSMGGLMTGLILRTRPELVSSAVLLNSPLPGVVDRIRSRDTLDRTGRALLVMKALARITAFGRPRLPRLLRRPELVMVRAALRGFVFDPGALDDRVIVRAILASRTTDGINFLELAEQLPEWESEPFSGVPVRIVLGADDPLVPPGDRIAIETAYPDAVITVLDDCGHFAHLEWPRATVDAISEWLA
jgi:pimeloyl-ACP methyl ester carboxylesterase